MFLITTSVVLTDGSFLFGPFWRLLSAPFWGLLFEMVDWAFEFIKLDRSLTFNDLSAPTTYNTASSQ